MADSNDSEDELYEEQDYGHAGRPPKPREQRIPKRPSLPDGNRSLDRFIEHAKAEPHRHDVSYFDPASREESMRKEIEDLKRRLADAEARSTAALQKAEAAQTP